MGFTLSLPALHADFQAVGVPEIASYSIPIKTLRKF